MAKIVARWLPAVAAGLLLTTGIQQARAGLGPHWEESGMASWYGPGFNGRLTSSGTQFDQDAMTAAHDRLPLGTRLRVTVQETGRSALVVVTDRMPPKHVRIIDLSRGAAKELGIVGAGTAMVTLTEAKPSDPLEVAEAPDDDAPAISPRRRGPQHRRHVGRTALGRH